MRTALVTGSSGQVGRAVSTRLTDAGWTVVPFDLVGGADLRDAEQVRTAARGCDAIAHPGAIAHDESDTPDEIMATNVLGTRHVLSAAEHHGIERVVTFSSGHVFGCAVGEGVPDSVHDGVRPRCHPVPVPVMFGSDPGVNSRTFGSDPGVTGGQRR